MKEWGPGDIIAIIIVFAATFLIYHGMDGVIASSLLAVVAFYFGITHNGPIVKAFNANKE